MPDYLNPNSLIQSDPNLTFGERTLRQYYRQGQMPVELSNSNASNALTLQALAADLPNKISASELGALRNKGLADPRMIQSYLEGEQGRNDQSFAAGTLARTGLEQQQTNKLQQLGIENRQQGAIIRDIDAVTKGVQQAVQRGLISPDQGAQAILTAKRLAGGNGKTSASATVKGPGLLSNYMDVFRAVKGADSSLNPTPPNESQQIADILANADPKHRGEMMKKGADFDKDLMSAIISGQFKIMAANASHEPKAKSLLDYITKTNGLEVLDYAARTGINPVTNQQLTPFEIKNIQDVLAESTKRKAWTAGASRMQGQANEPGMGPLGVPTASPGLAPPAGLGAGPAVKKTLPSGVKLSAGVHVDSKGNRIKVNPDGTYEDL